MTIAQKIRKMMMKVMPMCMGKMGELRNNMEEKKPTEWRFIWHESVRVFTASDEKAIRAYAEGAFESFGENCGHIEPMFPDPDEKQSLGSR